jgi:diguanylate cyclase (GGDEF)-like protein/PAS domain S-box-containing protein
MLLCFCKLFSIHVMQPSHELFAIGASVAVFTGLLVFSWKYRKSRTGATFLAFLFLALIWATGFALELIAASLAWKIFWTRLQFIGIAFLPLTWLLLVTTYLGLPLPSRIKWTAVIIPFATLVLVWVIPAPNWFWADPELVAPSGTISPLKYDYQWWFYYVHAPYGYLLVTITAMVLVREMTHVNRGYRAPLIVMLISVVLPAFGDVAYVLDFPPFVGLNPATAVMSVSGVMTGFVLYRYRFLSIVPVARSTVFETMTDGVLVLDRNQNIIDINPSAVVICGYSASPVGQSIAEAGPASLANAISGMVDRDAAPQEVTMGDEGSEDPARVYEVRLSALQNRTGERSGTIFSLREVTERVRLYEQVREISVLDDLTGIYNRRYFIEAGAREIDLVRRKQSGSVGVLIIDLDDFKSINDNHGHSVGDAVLKAVAAAARDSIRTIDILGRIGGDEFAVILPDTGEAACRRIGERLKDAIAAVSVQAGGGKVSVTASIGAASTESCESGLPDLEQLLHTADTSMYNAKRSGKNRIG